MNFSTRTCFINENGEHYTGPLSPSGEAGHALHMLVSHAAYTITERELLWLT